MTISVMIVVVQSGFRISAAQRPNILKYSLKCPVPGPLIIFFHLYVRTYKPIFYHTRESPAELSTRRIWARVEPSGSQRFSRDSQGLSDAWRMLLRTDATLRQCGTVTVVSWRCLRPPRRGSVSICDLPNRFFPLHGLKPLPGKSGLLPPLSAVLWT